MKAAEDNKGSRSRRGRRASASGAGALDYPRYLRLLHDSDFDDALILHGLGEQDVAACTAAVPAARLRTARVTAQACSGLLLSDL